MRALQLHDGWASYKRLSCLHGLCNAHHLRELTYVFEELKQPWAGRMMELHTKANQIKRSQYSAEVPALSQTAYAAQALELRQQYEAILDEGDEINCASSRIRQERFYQEEQTDQPAASSA